MVKEYGIAKIAHCLGCGPTIDTKLGFDLVVYNDGVAFAMGQVLTLVEIEDSQGINWEELIQEMKILHYFHVIHFDVRPENIGVCCTKRKPVFIDFGLAEVIKEGLGRKSNISF